MTNKQFCELDSSFYGEKVEKIGQVSMRTFNGEELKEYVEHFIKTLCPSSDIEIKKLDPTFMVALGKWFIIKVPIDSNNYWINDCGCLRYDQCNGTVSYVVDPPQIGAYLTKETHKVIATQFLSPDHKTVIVIEK